MHAGKACLFDYGEAIFKVFLRLCGKARDYVGSYGRFGEVFIYQRALFKVLRARVAAIHGLEHFVAPALERQVELRRKVF